VISRKVRTRCTTTTTGSCSATSRTSYIKRRSSIQSQLRLALKCSVSNETFYGICNISAGRLVEVRRKVDVGEIAVVDLAERMRFLSRLFDNKVSNREPRLGKNFCKRSTIYKALYMLLKVYSSGSSIELIVYSYF